MKYHYKLLGAALLAAISLSSAVSVDAVPVTFYTTPNNATFNSSGTASILWAGVGSTTVETNTPSGFTIADLGQFTVTGTQGVFAPTPFQITVNQTQPSAGNRTIGASLQGSIVGGGAGSDLSVIFSTTSFTIGDTRYELVNLTRGNTLYLDPRASSGITRLSAGISVPEPASMLLLGMGLSGLAASVRRGRRNRS